MSNNPKIQKKDDSKKVEDKPEQKPKQGFSAFVTEITFSNAMVYAPQNDKSGKKRTMSLAYVDVPRFDREKKLEECFAYETGEYLRKKLLTGKLIKFETIQENQGEVKAVVPFVRKENIIVSLLEKGYVVLRQSVKAPEIYVKAETKAKTEKVGVHHDNCVEICKKRPEHYLVNEKEAQELVGKTVSGFIKKIEAPGVYHIEMENRKAFIVHLAAVNQMLRRENFKYILDEDGEDAMEHCRKYFYKRDVTVEVREAKNGKLLGVVRQDKKDIAEDLLRNGFVVCAKLEGYPESIKQAYEKAEKEAKKGKNARWTDFDQALEDKIIAEKAEKLRKLEDRKKNCKVISGAEVKRIGKYIEIVKDGERYNVNLASVRFIMRQNKQAEELVMFRIKEVIRKQIVGKKFECKEAYRETIGEGEKARENVFYDVYAGGRNICLNLFKEGLVTLIRERDEFKRSFDYERFEEMQKQNIKYKETPIRMIEKEEKIKNKDIYIGTAPNCVLESIVAPNKFVIYLPERDVRMRVALKGCRIPRDDQNEELQKFLRTGKDFIRNAVGLNEVTVYFAQIEKGEFLCDITCKKFNFAEQLIENGYVMYIGKEAPNEKVDIMREAQDKIWKFQTQRKPRDEEEKPKPVVVRPKREFIKEIKFDEGKNVYITGYDGNDIYYYDNAEDAAYIEELNTKMKGLKKGKIEEKEGAKCIVDVKGKFYRAMIIAPVPTAFVIKCIDTGAVIVCGKNKLKPMPEEIEKFEAPKKIQQITLVGLKTPVRGKHEEFETSINAVAGYYNKEGKLYTCVFGETPYAKVIVGEVCINKMLVEEGLAVLNKSFKDNSEWGKEMFAAQEAAREKHTNMWTYGEFYDDEEREQKQ